MKTLFLSSIFPTSTLSVRGTFNRMLCHALNDDGEVRVVAPRPWHEVVKEIGQRITSPSRRNSGETAENGSETANHKTLQIERPTYFYPPKLMRHQYGHFMWASVERAVQRLTTDFTPDWVLSYWAHPDGEAGLRAARMLGANSGVIIGGSDVLLLTKDRKRCEQIKRVLQESDAVLAVCDGLNRRAVELGADPDRVHTLYQGIDPNVFFQDDRQAARQRLGVPADDAMFVWVGRMVGVKRLDVLVESFASVVKTRPDAKLYLLGEGHIEQTIRQLVASRGIVDSVIFVGAVQQSELPDWYRAADATLLSSESEGLPNVLRESLACGTPWVSTNVGSVEEISAIDHSIIVPIGDANRLCEGILQSLDPIYKAGAAAYKARTWQDTAHDLKQFMNGATSSTAGNNAMEPVAPGETRT